MDPYRTHIPVLETIFKTKNINSVLEFGMGYNSTPFFLERCKNVTSIEMQQKEWFDKITSEYSKTYKDWKHHLSIGPFAAFSLQEVMTQNYDLVFVDGHGDSRPECINAFFNKAEIIVAHDAEEPGYRWNLVNKPDNYNQYLFARLNPFTLIYSKDFDLIETIRDI
jgi:hypothetical protein